MLTGPRSRPVSVAPVLALAAVDNDPTAEGMASVLAEVADISGCPAEPCFRAVSDLHLPLCTDWHSETDRVTEGSPSRCMLLLLESSRFSS